jgi:hypothetical protein
MQTGKEKYADTRLHLKCPDFWNILYTKLEICKMGKSDICYGNRPARWKDEAQECRY